MGSNQVGSSLVRNYKTINDKHFSLLHNTLNYDCKRFNRAPGVGLLKKSLCLAAALGVTKLTNIRERILVTLSCAT
jgi:hypothetical protein